MKSLVAVGAVLGAAFGLQAANTVYNYLGPISGSSPGDPVDFSNPEYWDRKEMPSGLTSEAVFDKTVMGTLSAPLYLRLPNDLTLERVKGGGGQLVNLIGETITLNHSHYKDYAAPATMIYATALPGNGADITSTCGGFAGDVVASGNFTFSGGTTYHRHDYYANSDSETIVNALPSAKWVHGSGNFIFYAPRPCGEVTGLWKATKGSAFLTYAGSSPIHVVAPGAKVSCSGVVAEGAFVRRWFPDAKTIELSSAALDDAEAAELTFHAYNPSVRQEVKTWHKQATFGNTARLNKWTPEQEAILEVERIEDGDEYVLLGAADDRHPWHMIFHDVAFGQPFQLSNADIEFGESPAGVLRGFWKQPVSQVSTKTMSTITVPESVGYIRSLTGNAKGGGLVKKGAGELVTQVLGNLEGTIEVAEGTLSITNACDGGTVYSAGTLIVRSGATLKLLAPAIGVTKIEAEDGATVVYPKTLLFETAAEAEAFVAPDGMTIGLIGGGAITVQRLGRDSGLTVAEDETLTVVEADGVGGTFTKSGAGDLVLKALGGALDSLVVAGGKMTLYSRANDKNLVPPVWAHFDAMGDFGSVTTDSPSVRGEGTTSVKQWVSASTQATAVKLNPVTTNHPLLKVVQNCTAVPGMNGKTVVDLGPQLYVKDVCGTDNMNADPPNGCGYGYLSKYGYSTALSLSPATAKAGDAGSIKTMFWVLGSAAGGATLTGDAGEWGGYNDGWTIMRGVPFFKGDLSAGAAAPMVDRYTSTRTFRLNGKVVDESMTGFSGSWDIVTVVDSAGGFGAKAFGQAHYGKWSGGQELGEVIISTEKFTDDQVCDVEAYLRKKWFEIDTPGFVAASATALTVADGAELEVVGKDGLVVSSVTGGGTVSGTVKVTGPLAVGLTVANNAISPFSISGEAVDLTQGGSISLGGDVDHLDLGVYDLVVSDKVLAGQPWTLTVANARRRAYTLFVEDGAVKVQVQKLGAVLIIR